MIAIACAHLYFQSHFFSWRTPTDFVTSMLTIYHQALKCLHKISLTGQKVSLAAEHLVLFICWFLTQWEVEELLEKEEGENGNF